MARKVSEDDDDYWSKSNKIIFDFTEEEEDFIINLPMLDEDQDWDDIDDEFLTTSDSLQSTGDLRETDSQRKDTYPGSARSTAGNVRDNFEPNKSITDTFGAARTKTAPTHTQVAKLETEVQSLKRRVESVNREVFHQIPPEDTVKRMIKGEPYHLEHYRALQDKLALLDAAIKFHDGNSITAAVLFLKNTVKKSIFNRELMKRPDAVTHYLSYLKQHYDYTNMEDILAMLDRIEDGAMLKYKLAIGSSNPESKKRLLDNCIRTHFDNQPGLAYETDLVKQHHSLLERQIPIDAADAREEKEGKSQKFKQYPRAAPLINMSVMTTLYYCCIYHYELSENSFASPLAIRKAHQLQDKQYLWVALPALSRLKHWNALESLLTSKSWFGTKLKCPIGFHKVVEIIAKTGAPNDVLSKYLRYIEDEEKRLELAMKCYCHEVVVDVFISMKDRQQLEAYKAKILEPHTKPYYYAQDALSTSSIKWKN